MAAIEIALQGVFIVLIWVLMGQIHIFNEKDKVAGKYFVFAVDSWRFTQIGLYTSMQKSLGLGIPLINAMFGTQSDVGVLTIPLLIYHPLQVLYYADSFLKH